LVYRLLVRKATADPMDELEEAKAVAVVLSDVGNQITERRDGAAKVMQPVTPFNTEPMATNLQK